LNLGWARDFGYDWAMANSGTDKTIEKTTEFTKKWCPSGKGREFLGDLRELIEIATKEATEYMIAGTGTGKN
jgi:hypothetical protein